MKINPALRSRLRKKILQEVKKPSGRTVTVKSAVKMTAKDIITLQKSLPELKDAKITNEVDKDILGGLIIVDGSKIIDVSIKGKIETLVNSLLTN